MLFCPRNWDLPLFDSGTEPPQEFVAPRMNVDGEQKTFTNQHKITCNGALGTERLSLSAMGASRTLEQGGTKNACTTQRPF